MLRTCLNSVQFKNTGYLVRALADTIHDTAYFLLILLVILAAFTNSIYVLLCESSLNLSYTHRIRGNSLLYKHANEFHTILTANVLRNCGETVGYSAVQKYHCIPFPYFICLCKGGGVFVGGGYCLLFAIACVCGQEGGRGVIDGYSSSKKKQLNLHAAPTCASNYSATPEGRPDRFKSPMDALFTVFQLLVLLEVDPEELKTDSLDTTIAVYITYAAGAVLVGLIVLNLLIGT